MERRENGCCSPEEQNGILDFSLPLKTPHLSSSRSFGSAQVTPSPFSPQFFDRLKLFWMPAKHQPDFIYLRHVPLRKVHLFTLIQLLCLVLLWAIKASRAAIIFPMMVRDGIPGIPGIPSVPGAPGACGAPSAPRCSRCSHCSQCSQPWRDGKRHLWPQSSSLLLLQVLALVFVRKVMDFCFSKRELSFLDDLMPESKKKKLDDAKNEAKEEEVTPGAGNLWATRFPVPATARP